MEGKINGRRLVLFPLPYVGHLNPMFELANILHAKGFSISIVHTRFNSPDPTKHPHFTFLPIDDGLSECEASSGQDVIAVVTKLNITCVEPLENCLSQLIVDSEPVACLIADAMWHFSQAVADRLKLQRIVLRTGNLASFAAFVALPLLQERGYLLPDAEPEDLVAELPPLRVKDIPKVKTSDPQQTSELLTNLVRETKASRGLIFNSFEELEDCMITMVRREFSATPVFTFGPFHKCVASSLSSLASSTISWLNTQSPKTVLYVSFGSLAAIDEAQFFEFAWGLANSNQPFLWVLRPGLVQGTNGVPALPNGFFEKVTGRAHIVDWAPQKVVLAHPAVGGFLTHSGWNSTLESICEGVPMICFPCFGDQMVNARYVTDIWKVGLQFETGLSKGEVEKVIRRLLVEEEGKEMRKRIECLKNAASATLMAGGSSYNALENLSDLILSF